MHRTILVAAAVAVAGLSVIGVLALGQGKAPPPGPKEAASSAPPPAATAPVALAAAGPGSTSDPLPASLLYEYADVDTTKAQAVTCLIFNEPLDASGQTDYAAFFTLKPAGAGFACRERHQIGRQPRLANLARLP